MMDVDELGKLFGGKVVLASYLNLSPSALSQWKDRRGGTVPQDHISTIMLGARDIIDKGTWDKAKYETPEEWLEKVRSCLDIPVCPKCGHPLEG
ncbi:hypothetical protein [uncultured Paraglaciecola sp.]|uniref:hypothetical protein n=1 Tax=uncultured Paraglaciecola sp. TaxID=1765024 RepID=UPI00261B4CB5|nr:hypothetical protein [uncultured Paraglaciecola sp.]